MAQPIVVEKRAGLAPARGIPLQAGLVLALAVAAQSTGTSFLRMAENEGVPVLVIVGLRLALATLILTPLVWRGFRVQLRALSRRDLGLAALAGVFLALHFLCFTASLGVTTVLVTILFGRTNSLWTALLEAGVLRARIGRLVWIGMGVAVLGGAVIALGSGSDDLGANPLLGGFLATTGALCFASYAVVGRAVRPKVDNLPYVWLVYGAAAIVANLALLGSGSTPLGYNGRGYLWIVLVALVPLLIGHSGVNYALRFVSATLTGIAGQGVVVGSVILAAILFGEIPGPIQIAGAIAILAGITIALLGQGSGPTVARDVLPEEV